MTSIGLRMLGAVLLIAIYQLNAAVGIAALAAVVIYIVVERHHPPITGGSDATEW